MSRKIEINKSQKFSKISIGLASPETILGSQEVKFLNQKQLITELINLKEMVCFVKEFLVL